MTQVLPPAHEPRPRDFALRQIEPAGDGALRSGIAGQRLMSLLEPAKLRFAVGMTVQHPLAHGFIQQTRPAIDTGLTISMAR